MTFSDEAQLITREDAARLLDVSVSEMKRKQSLGQIRVAKRGHRGVVLFFRDEIVAMRGSRILPSVSVAGTEVILNTPFSAEEAKLVFTELEKGASAIECVNRCDVHPDKVESIIRSYERLSGAVLLNAATMAIINKLPLDGTFPVTKAEGILELLQANGGAPCSVCSKRPKHLCKTCAIPFVRQKLSREAKAPSHRPTTEEADDGED